MKNLNFTQEELETLFNIINQLIYDLEYIDEIYEYVLQSRKLIDCEDIDLEILGSLQKKLFKELKSLYPELF